jgi:hypothetical protein
MGCITHADLRAAGWPVSATGPGIQDSIMALAAGFGLLILFGIITIALGDEDATSTNDSRDDLLVWMHLARR